MLKRLAILGLLMAICGSAPPVPGEMANGGIQPSQNPKNKTNTSQSPAESPSVITIVRKNCNSEAFKNDSDCKAADQKPSSIEISKFPPANVTIQRNAQRDIPDWITYFGDLLLVVVGIGTLIAVWVQARRMKEHAVHLKGLADYAESNTKTTTETLLEIRRQADLMTKQTEKMERSVAASEKSAEAALAQIQMVKDKERSRISVSVNSNELQVSPAYSFDAIPIEIANDGTTSAFGVRAKGEVFGQPGDAVPYMGNFFPLNIPSVIRASNDPTQTEVILVQDIDLSGLDNSPIPYFFHIGGSVEYEDAFGDTHVTNFRLRFRANAAQQIPGSSSWRVKSLHGWERCGSPQENHAD